jgi:DNA-directed RNA polymerase specialized sigma24 family protein
MPDYDERLTAADAELIRHKVRRLIGHHGFTTHDIEDLEQDLCLHVLQRSSRFDAVRGSRHAFIATVIKNKILNILDGRTAQRRDRRREELFGEMSGIAVTGDKERQRDLAVDIRGAVGEMTPDLRLVAGLLGEEGTFAGVSRRAGLSRQQVRGRQSHIKAHLTAAGLVPELPSSTTHPRGAPVLQGWRDSVPSEERAA